MTIDQNLVSLGKDGSHDGDKISAMSEMDQSQYPFQLLQAHNRGCSTQEPHYRRVRQEIHYKP